MANQEHVAWIQEGIRNWNLKRVTRDFVPDFSNHDFNGAYLVGANFRNANLKGADFSFANLRNADLTDADLTGANLTTASLSGSQMTFRAEQFSREKRQEVDEKVFIHRANAAKLFGLPDRSVAVVRASFKDGKLHALLVTKKEKHEFSKILQHAEKLARQIAGSRLFDNVAPQIHSAVVAYVESISEYHEGEGEIPIGLAGRLLVETYDAMEKQLMREFSEDLGPIRNLAFTHQLLERHLEEWKALIAETGNLPFSLADNPELQSQVAELSASMRKSDRVDNNIPRTLEFFEKLIDDPRIALQDVGFAIVRGIEDVFIELFSVVVDFYSASKDLVTKRAPAIAAIALISYLVGSSPSLLKMIENNERLIGWIRRGLKWLESIK